MRDKRPVDELSIEDLERILAIRKREQRQERLRRYEGRRVGSVEVVAEPPRQHEAAENVPPLEPPVTYDLTDDVPRFEDELEEKRPRPQTVPVERHGEVVLVPKQRVVWDRFLLLVEILAVLGFAGLIGYGTYYLTRENDKIDKKMNVLKDQSAAIQQQYQAMRATPTPAPELRVRLSDYLLPDNHAAPSSGGSYGLNMDELNDLPPSIQQAAIAQFNNPVLVPTVVRTSASPIRIEIPSLDPPVDASIFGGDSWITLIQGVGHMDGSANPGERGNMVLTAHDDIYGELFKNIDKLQPGDVFYVTAQDGKRYTYVVTHHQDVAPTDVWVLQSGNTPTATLITCWPYRVDNRRWVVFAELRSDAS